MTRLAGKVAVVTGAAQGIGARLALGLAGHGARIVVADVADTDACVEAIKGAGGDAIGVRADVTSNSDLQAMVAAAEQAFGPIEILINNASLFAALRLTPMMEMSEEEWDRVMRVNLRGPFQCVKAVVPSMERAGRGKIINISSGTVFYGAPGFLHYVTSKGGVIAMSRSMARELGDKNITVNTITPGLTISEGIEAHQDFANARQPTVNMRVIKREMLPDDLVGAAIFLASPDSDFITGQVVNVDGGRSMY